MKRRFANVSCQLVLLLIYLSSCDGVIHKDNVIIHYFEWSTFCDGFYHLSIKLFCEFLKGEVRMKRRFTNVS